MGLLIPLIALISPFFIWIIEIILPYPYLVEETVKLGLIFLLLSDSRVDNRQRLIIVILSAILFSLSESVFYLFNIYAVGSSQTLFIRLVTTTLMHLVTFLIIYTSSLRNRWGLVLGFLGAVLVHYLFNRYI